VNAALPLDELAALAEGKAVEIEATQAGSRVAP